MADERSFQDRLRVLKVASAPVEPSGLTTDAGALATATAADIDDRALESLKVELHGKVIAALGPRLNRSRRAGGDIEGELREAIEEVLDDLITTIDRPLSQAERQRLRGDVIADVQGYGPIDQYLRDDSVSEIMVNGPDQVYIERDGLIIETATRFVDDAHVARIIDRIVSEVGRRVDESSPMVDARLPDGSRVNAILPPLSLVGPILTIRKFRAEPLRVEDLVRFGTLTHRAARFLELCVAGKANVIVSGGTGTGKTTMLNVLSSGIPQGERIVTIEDAAELQLDQVHLLRLESRPANVEGSGQVAIRDLLRNTLRMRPDRIIVGEVRGGEAVDMLQAMNTGHDGSMTTIHANTPRDGLARIETMVLSSDVELPVKAIREQVSSALHLIVQLSRLVDGTRRVTRITEVCKMEGDVVTLQDIYAADPVHGDAVDAAAGSLLAPLRATGVRPTFLDHLKQNGVTLPDDLFEDDGTPAPAEPSRRIKRGASSNPKIRGVSGGRRET